MPSSGQLALNWEEYVIIKARNSGMTHVIVYSEIDEDKIYNNSLQMDAHSLMFWRFLVPASNKSGQISIKVGPVNSIHLAEGIPLIRYTVWYISFQRWHFIYLI